MKMDQELRSWKEATDTWEATDINLILKALKIAYEAHKKQNRKGTDIPYIVHLLDVTKSLIAEKEKDDAIIAGILHDTLEDTHFPPEEIEKEFGLNVLKLVKLWTESKFNADSKREERKESWWRRKEHTISLCNDASKEELMILLADKLSSLRDIKEDVLINKMDWNNFNAGEGDQAKYYNALREQFEKKLSDKRMFKIFDKLCKEIFKSDEKNDKSHNL